MREVFNTNCAVELNNLKQGLQETTILRSEISSSADANRNGTRVLRTWCVIRV